MTMSIAAGQSFSLLSLDKVRTIFDKYDKDKAGAVNLSELVPVFSGNRTPSEMLT